MVVIWMAEFRIDWKHERCQFKQQEMKDKGLNGTHQPLTQKGSNRAVIAEAGHDFTEICHIWSQEI